VPESIAKFIATLQASFKTHTWWWAGGGGGVVVAAVLAVLVFGGVFGPSGRAVCTATLEQARDFGVLPFNASLSSTSAKSTDVDGRKQCTAQADGQTYIMTVDVKKKDADNKACKDFKKQHDCLALFSVANAQGMMTYQYRQPPDDEDASVPVPQQQAASPGATDPGAIDTETATDNSAAPAAAPADAGQQ
jgi:hypothetical protein